MTRDCHLPKVIDVDGLVALFPLEFGGLIAVDGCINAGKTTLAQQLAVQLACSWMDVDDYVTRGQWQYVAAVRRSDLAAAIERELDHSHVVVLAGLCLREVLQHLGRNAAFSVYVQRDAPLGPPYDYETLDLEDSEPDEHGEPNGVDATGPDTLSREVCRYHARYRPRFNADVVYVWIDQEHTR